MSEATIEVIGLRKRFGQTVALDGLTFTVAPGTVTGVSIAHGPTLRAAVGSVLYLGLIALLSLGIATVVRDTAVSTGVVLGLLYLPPILAQLVTGSLRRHLEQIAPMSAGLAIQATRDIHTLPISPWAGLGVLAAWAVGALLVGGAAFRIRDA